jgi:hypothetical protein
VRAELSVEIVAIVAFGLAIVGAVLGMSQTWCTGYAEFTGFRFSSVASGIFDLRGE